MYDNYRMCTIIFAPPFCPPSAVLDGNALTSTLSCPKNITHTHTNGRAAAAIQDAAAFSIMDPCLAQGHFDTFDSWDSNRRQPFSLGMTLSSK